LTRVSLSPATVSEVSVGVGVGVGVDVDVDVAVYRGVILGIREVSREERFFARSGFVYPGRRQEEDEIWAGALFKGSWAKTSCGYG
jgi:hypothetical protein